MEAARTLPIEPPLSHTIYARHGVPEVWIVDLPHERLLAYGEPEAGTYRREHAIEHPGVVPVAALPGVTVDLSGVFGRLAS